MLPITTGVPQGSILGPLLFIIFFCSFNEEQNTQERIVSLSQVVNNGLKEIQKWLELNKLSLNVKKTKYMIFYNHQRDIINHISKLELNGEPLVRVANFNFLGLTIDRHMTWNAQIQKLSNKISRSLGIMNRLKWYLPQNIFHTIYNSLILSHINHSILVWEFKSSRISKLQKRAVRMISCSKYNAHTEPLYKSLNLLKVEDIFKIKTLEFYYKYSRKKHYFILMKCSPKLLIDIIMELDNNQFKLFINIHSRTDIGRTEMHKAFATWDSQ